MRELAHWHHEKRSAYFYRLISDAESGNLRQLLFLELAHDADEQAKHWQQVINAQGGAVPARYLPDIRVKAVTWLLQHVGLPLTRPVLAMMKIRGLSVYSGHRLADHATPAAPEADGIRANDVGSARRHADVLGVNDGLVSIALLVLLVAGASRETGVVLLTGVAGLLAGALVMAIGEYWSARSRRTMLAYQMELERDGLAQPPRQEVLELALIYQARGMEQEEANTLAQRMVAESAMESDVFANRPLGQNQEPPDSPQQAALHGFFAFVVGGIVPLAPYLLGVQHHPLLMSIVLSAIACFVVGTKLSQLSGREPVWGGFRMLAIGGGTGLLIYLIGYLIGSK